jgi:hypothetical protein
MASSKRSFWETQLQRRVQARRDSSKESEDDFNDSASEILNYREADSSSDHDAQDTLESSEEDNVVWFPIMDVSV